MSLISLCLRIGKPPLLQVMAWLMEKEEPQTHDCGVLRMSHPYRRCSASLNSPLFKKKPCSSIGVTVSQDDAPFSLARAICLFWSIERTLLSSFAWQMSLKRFELLMFFLASSVSSRLTDPFRFWAVMRFTCGLVRVTEA